MAVILAISKKHCSYFFVCSEHAANDSIFCASPPAHGGITSSSGKKWAGQHLLGWLSSLSLLTFTIWWRSLTIIFSVSSRTVVNKLNRRAIQARPKRIQMATSVIVGKINPARLFTYYIISKANGAEGDKCKVNSFTVGPTLCYLEEEWRQAQKH